MAGKTGAGVGVVVTITVLGVFVFGLFVGTIVLWGQYSETKRLLDEANEVNVDYVRPDEREVERVRELLREAQQERETLVRHLVDTRGELMSTITGFPEDTLEDLDTKAETVVVSSSDDGERTLATSLAASGSLFGVVESMRLDAEALELRALDAEDARDEAEDELSRRISEFDRFRDAQASAVGELQRQIDDLSSDAESYRDGIARQEQVYAERLDDFERQAGAREDTLRQRLEDVERQNLILQESLSRLRREQRGETLQPLPEEALVDGTIIGVNAAEREAFVSLGRDDNVVLGMRFSVYGDATLIRPDDNGVYPQGKANLEIISISEDSSRARILSEARGNPVVVGDVLANAAYDPDKTYKFMVIGNYATAGATVATPAGADEIRTLISGWGGQLEQDLTGDIDMLVLGERPRIPPQPPVDATIEIFDEFRRLERKAERYDRLLEYARATSIPVLNQNRLYTLIGGAPARTR